MPEGKLPGAATNQAGDLVDCPLGGGVAQLGERRVRNAKVGSSILLLSTTKTSKDVPADSRKLESPGKIIALGLFLVQGDPAPSSSLGVSHGLAKSLEQ